MKSRINNIKGSIIELESIDQSDMSWEAICDINGAVAELKRELSLLTYDQSNTNKIYKGVEAAGREIYNSEKAQR